VWGMTPVRTTIMTASTPNTAYMEGYIERVVSSCACRHDATASATAT
jgi:hypothetical protein